MTAPLWAGAIVVAGVGTAIGFRAAPGLNWAIWTTLAGGGLLWLSGRGAPRTPGDRTPRVDRLAVCGVALAIVVSLGAAITDNSLFEFFTFVTCLILLAMASRAIGGMPARAMGAVALARAPFDALWPAVGEAGSRAMTLMAGARGDRHAATFRGVLIATPVAVIFAVLLAGADPLLTIWRDKIWDVVAAGDLVSRLVFFAVLGTIVLGTYGLALRLPAESGPAEPAAGKRRIGSTERRLVVGAVALVFAVFLAVQPTYLFRDVHALRVSGMTYAQYAHEGFVELTFAATLAVWLVLALDRYASPRAEAQQLTAPSATRWRYWGTLILLGEVLVVLASAFHRLTLYESAYGYTTLRLYVQAYMAGVAITLLLLAGAVADLSGVADTRQVARRAGLVAIALLLLFSFGNPEAWVVARNMERYRAMGEIDGRYLTDLSSNAVPAVLAALPELPVMCAASIRWNLGEHTLQELDRAHHWYEWNLRRTRALRALRAANIERPTTPNYLWQYQYSACAASPAKHWNAPPIVPSPGTRGHSRSDSSAANTAP